MYSIEHGLKVGPASPEDEPAGVGIVFAVLVAAQAGQSETEIMNCPVRLLAIVSEKGFGELWLV